MNAPKTDIPNTAIITPIANNPSVSCTTDGYFPSNDCSSYYQCFNSIKVEITCPIGTLFDQNTNVCNWASLVTCSSAIQLAVTSETQTDMDMQMPMMPSSSQSGCSSDGIFASTDCRTYIQCLSTNTVYASKHVISCPPGTLFDQNIKSCNWASMVTCAGNTELPITPMSITTSASQQTTILNSLMPNSRVNCLADGLFASIDCRSYFQCSNTNTQHANSIQITCPVGTLFDQNTQICNWSGMVKCNQAALINQVAPIVVSSTQQTSSTAALNTDQSTKCSRDGIFASPDCLSYIQCVHTNTPFANRLVISCPTGTLFDTNSNTCNWAYAVTCS